GKVVDTVSPLGYTIQVQKECLNLSFRLNSFPVACRTQTKIVAI
ncbi:MAG: hypothetical protein ACI9T7_003228, partial [Oleiphilaceae bacterium]